MQNTIINGPNDAKVIFILAHGAGAGMDTPFMNQVAEGLASYGAKVIRFEFPYMTKRRQTNTKRPPDRAPVLLDYFRQIISTHTSDQPDNSLIIGGKSMGGRIASMIAAEEDAKNDVENDNTTNLKISGCVCLGYPFHPPAKLDKLRTEHFKTLKTPTLICQGERDNFGTKDEVPAYNLPAIIEMFWLGDGDHSFKPRVKSGRTIEQNIGVACEEIARKFIK